MSRISKNQFLTAPLSLASILLFVGFLTIYPAPAKANLVEEPTPSQTVCPSSSPKQTPAPEVTPSPTPNVTPSPTSSPTSGGGGTGGGSTPGMPGAPVCGETKPGTATLLSVDRNSSTEVTLNWVKATGANNYSIQYGYSSGKYTFGATGVGNVDTFKVGSLTPNTNYCFVVRSYNSCQPGELSNEICLTTSGGGGGTSSGSSGSGGSGGVGGGPGQVLGTTTLANTGSFNNNGVSSFLILLSSLMIGYGLLLKKAH